MVYFLAYFKLCHGGFLTIWSLTWTYPCSGFYSCIDFSTTEDIMFSFCWCGGFLFVCSTFVCMCLLLFCLVGFVFPKLKLCNWMHLSIFLWHLLVLTIFLFTFFLPMPFICTSGFFMCFNLSRVCSIIPAVWLVFEHSLFQVGHLNCYKDQNERWYEGQSVSQREGFKEVFAFFSRCNCSGVQPGDTKLVGHSR